MIELLLLLWLSLVEYVLGGRARSPRCVLVVVLGSFGDGFGGSCAFRRLGLVRLWRLLLRRFEWGGLSLAGGVEWPSCRLNRSELVELGLTLQ